MPGQQRRDVDVALLQNLSWIQKIKRAFNLAMHRLIAAHLRAIKAGAQAVDLIIDFAPALIQRISQGGIDASQLLLKIIQLRVERSGGVIKSVGGLFTQIFLHHARQDVIYAAKKISQANAVTIQRAPGMSFNQRQAGAMKYWRGRPAKDAIKLGGFREVPDLRGAAIVGNSRQQKILNDGAQRNVRTEAIWLAQSPISEFLR